MINFDRTMGAIGGHVDDNQTPQIGGWCGCAMLLSAKKCRSGSKIVIDVPPPCLLALPSLHK